MDKNMILTYSELFLFVLNILHGLL